MGIRPIEANWQPLPIKSALASRGLCGVFQITFRGRPEVSGRLVVIDPNQCRVKLVVDGNKTLRQIVAENGQKTFFACNGPADNLRGAGSAVVAAGQTVKSSGPALPPTSLRPFDDCSFLTLDPRIPRLQRVYFSAGEPTTGLNFMNGIAGPLIVHNMQRVGRLIGHAGHRDSDIRHAAVSAAGANDRGDLIFVSLTSNPELESECLVDDITNLLWDFKAVSAILLGVGYETQQYVRSAAAGDPHNPWLVTRDESPLATAIVVQEID